MIELLYKAGGLIAAIYAIYRVYRRFIKPAIVNGVERIKDSYAEYTYNLAVARASKVRTSYKGTWKQAWMESTWSERIFLPILAIGLPVVIVVLLCNF